jgi:hypothetical protein
MKLLIKRIKIFFKRNSKSWEFSFGAWKNKKINSLEFQKNLRETSGSPFKPLPASSPLLLPVLVPVQRRLDQP